MSYWSQRQANPTSEEKDSLPTLAELRRLEDHLDWLENQRPPKHRRLSLAPVLLPVAALATALWLRKPHG